MLEVGAIIISRPVCDRCSLYKETLDREIEHREYLERLLLTKAGLIDKIDEQDMEDTDMSFPSIGKRNTLSHMRLLAESESRKKAKALRSDDTAKPTELTAAEKLFQDRLNSAS